MFLTTQETLQSSTSESGRFLKEKKVKLFVDDRIDRKNGLIGFKSSFMMVIMSSKTIIAWNFVLYAGEVLVKIAATSVNPVDYKVRNGGAYAPVGPKVLHLARRQSSSVVKICFKVETSRV